MEVRDSSVVDDLNLQKLDSNVFFGPCEILTQPILLQYENIKFIIGVNISTEKIASFYTQYFRNSNSVIVNLCSPTTAATKKPTIGLYIQNNTILLQKLVGQYLQMGKKIKTSLTQARTDTILSLIHIQRTKQKMKWGRKHPMPRERYFNISVLHNMCGAIIRNFFFSLNT